MITVAGLSSAVALFDSCGDKRCFGTGGAGGVGVLVVVVLIVLVDDEVRRL